MKKFFLMTILLLWTVAASAQLSFTARAGADYTFSRLFSVRPMLYYTTKGCSYGKNNLGFSPDRVYKRTGL